MRWVFTIAAAVALAGCDRPAPDNRSARDTPVVAPDGPKRTIQASFDCDRARGQAQELICADGNLAAMDREVSRLAGLAAEPAGLADYTQKRDSCGKADELRRCVMATAALEIHRLRHGSEAARVEGMSVGPVAFSCKGLAGPVLATFINSDPGALALEFSGKAIAIDQVQSGSGARYDGRWDGENYAFWSKGRDATFTVAGKGDIQCSETAAD